MKDDVPLEPNNSIIAQMRGNRLTTARILYHLPDYPQLLQEFIWQHLDIAPEFPRLHQFLDYWERKIDGRLHSVEIASAKLVTPGRLRGADALLTLH